MREPDVLEQADAERIGKAAEATMAQADEDRLLATKREAELNRIAGDLPDDATALWTYAEHSLAQMAVSTIDAGRALIKLKETLPHGDYTIGLEERSINPRTAREITAIARRFADRSDKLLKLGRTKLYACLEFSDDELDALESGETVERGDLSYTLDELDHKNTRELKQEIKKLRADNMVKDQLLETKNRQIDEVAEENARLRNQKTEPGEVVRMIELQKQQTIDAITDLTAWAITLEKAVQSGEPIDRSEYLALQGALDECRNKLAAGLDAIYSCGGNLTTALEEAGSAAYDPAAH